MDAFPPEVIEKLGYYVYRLIDPRNGEVFYVGKGKGNRVFAHAAGVIGEETATLSDKFERIREIRLAGLEVQHVIHRHGLDSDTAYEVEAALMEAYPGVTNIAGGHGNSDRGTAHALEIMERYCAEPIEINEPILEILVPKTATSAELYDSTRFAWKLSPNRAAEANFVLAVKNGVVVGVFEAIEWLPATIQNFPTLSRGEADGRFGFIGREAPQEAQEKYLRKRMPARPRGAANPVRYLGF